MGFLGEIRKLLFGVTSVSKSGAEKVATKGREIGEDLVDRGADVLDKGRDVASDVLDKGMDMAGDAYDKGKDIAGDVLDRAGDTLGSLKDKAKDLLGDIQDSPATEKAANFTEGVGKKVIEVGGDLTEKAADLSETVGEKVLDAKDKIMEKAKEIGGKVSEKYDETYEKAKELEAQEALEPKGEFADTVLDAGGSLLEETDDFFAKAEKYADGNYSGKAKVETPEGNPGDIQIGDTTISLPPAESKKEMAKAAGFEDLDGDGNEVVDDAIIIEDEVVDAAEQVVEDAKALGTGMANEAQDALSQDVNQKVDEMKDMMDTVLGEEE